MKMRMGFVLISCVAPYTESAQTLGAVHRFHEIGDGVVVAEPRYGGGNSTVIINAKVLDGTGASARSDSVRLIGDRIIEVGAVKPTPRDTVIDADGLVLAPGFIDTHSHVDDDIFEQGGALAMVSQGITTAVVGQDGGSKLPLREFFRQLNEAGTGGRRGSDSR